jgi:hypothetical protein
MEEFNQQNPHLFKEELAEIAQKYRSNIQYFIYKSIILRNLYGVDIMAEAVEIAKLRLFLKMVAVVEADRRAPNLGLDPLPDIDFNIRCGNTLVGYASEKEVVNAYSTELFTAAAFREQMEVEMTKVAKAYEHFRRIQLSQHEDMAEFKEAKEELHTRLSTFTEQLNQQMFSRQLGGEEFKQEEYEAYLASHQPFHWFAEYYQIIHGNGGFDVIIGNPPYLERKQIHYSLSKYKTLDSNAVHAYCIERSLRLLGRKGAMSMIVPLAIVCTQRMVVLQNLLENHVVWYSNFAWRPAKLFDAVNRALTIFVAHKMGRKNIYTSPYRKWFSDSRDILFQLQSYEQYNVVRKSFWIPKLKANIETGILAKVLAANSTLPLHIGTSENYLYYRTTGGLYWKVFTNFSPLFLCNGREGKSSRETKVAFQKDDYPSLFVALLSSNLFWWWYTITSNLRDLNPSDINGFHFSERVLADKKLYSLSDKYLSSLKSNSTMLIREQKGKGTTQTQSFKIKLSKPIIDEIDKVLAEHYGFTEEELDFIINYDIKYRMGDELEAE